MSEINLLDTHSMHPGIFRDVTFIQESDSYNKDIRKRSRQVKKAKGMYEHSRSIIVWRMSSRLSDIIRNEVRLIESI